MECQQVFSKFERVEIGGPITPYLFGLGKEVLSILLMQDMAGDTLLVVD